MIKKLNYYVVAMLCCVFVITGCCYDNNPRVSDRNAKVIQGQGPRFFSKAMRIRKYNEQNGICPRCNRWFEIEFMHGDHIIPYSKGGCTVYENLQMLCVKCNLEKSDNIE